MRLRLHLDLLGRFAERIAKRGVFVHALAQVVGKHAQLAIIFGIDGDQMHARPIQIGMRGGLAQRDANAAHLNGGKQFHQSAFQACGHAGRVGVQKQLRELREHFVGNGFAGGEHDIILRAPARHWLGHLRCAGLE